MVKTIVKAVSLLIILSLLIIGFCKIDFSLFWSYLNSFSYSTLTLLSLFFILVPLIGALRWHILIGQISGKSEKKAIIAGVFLERFYSSFLPFFVGDAARLFTLTRATVAKDLALLSILSDRFYAIYGIFLSALFATPFLFPYTLGPIFYFSIVVCSIIFIGLNIPFFIPEHFLQKLHQKYTHRFLSGLLGFAISLHATLKNSKIAALSILLSVLMQLIISVIYVLLTWKINPNIPFHLIIAIAPWITFGSFIPISFMNWGAREGLSIFLFHYLGLSYEQAFAITTFFSIINTIVSLPGSLMFLTIKTRKIIHEH